MPGHLPSELHRRAGVDRRSIRGRLQNGERITQAAQVGARRLCSVKVLQCSVPQKRDKFAPINASPEYKEAFKKREDMRPLRAELREARETGADEKKLDRTRAKIHYRLTQLASFQAVEDRKQYFQKANRMDLRAWRPQHFRLHIINPLLDHRCRRLHKGRLHLPRTCSGTLLLPRK